jgi:hypothetical protein
MYLPELLNSNGLFQKVYAWKKGSSCPEEFSTLLYRASACVIHMRRLAELNHRCVMEFGLFEDQLALGDDRIVFHSTSLLALLNEISPLLSSLRIMQDMLLPLIGKTKGKSMPSSINDGIKRLHTLGLPDEIRRIILGYWPDGNRLRDYRIIDQHHTNLVTHTFFQIRPVKKVLVLFPDNPGIKTSKKFTYEKSINGIEYLCSAFSMLHAVYEDIAEALGFEGSHIENEIGMAQHGVLLPARKRTLAFWYEANQSISTNGAQINISGLEIRQKDDGGIELQNILLSEAKLLEAKALYGA